MKLHVERKNETLAEITIAATPEELAKIKTKVLKKLAPLVKMAGFRAGKAPLELIEKNSNQQTLQSEFLDEAINTLYIAALKSERIRPVGQPKVEIKKFVPFTTLDIFMELPVVGTVTLPNYKKIPVKRGKVSVSADEVSSVIENLRTRVATKNEVSRPAKNGDEAWIDFKGVDAKGVAVKGADGTDYPLALGSGTFIPGFEDNVVGMKPGDTKEFTVTFPKEYGVKSLQNAKVTFSVTLKKVQEISKPKLDDAFASSVGPFKTVAELKADIKKQLEHEAAHKVERDFEAALLDYITAKTKVEIPDSLIEEQKELVLNEVRQNAIQRGMTYQELLEQQGLTDEEFVNKEVTPEALRRIKAGLVLSEIGDKEGIDVTAEELEARMQQLKGQYPDKQMQEQLDLPDSRREINARLRSEKVIKFIKDQIN